jgi:tetratricopeptide (TPR) repeat protein
MPKKSRQRMSHGKLRPDMPAGNTAPIAHAADKPWQVAVVCIILAVVTVFAFRGVWSNGFVTLDDNEYVLENKQVQQGITLQSLDWAFTTLHAANWHPLTWISHMMDWRIYGNHPSGHHMTSVCLHAANAVLLFLLLLYVTGYMGRAAVAALLFALHPAHVESVAWIAERKDVLCAFFWLATLLAYAWYVRRPSWKRFAWVVCGCACALMSKPMAVTLPFTLLLLDYWPLRRMTFSAESRSQWLSSLWKLCVEKWPLFLMVIISSVITFIAQKAGGAVFSLQALPLWMRLCNAIISYWRYIRIMLWPDPLTVYYYYDANSIKVFVAALSAVMLILVTALFWRIRKNKPYCLMGWLWFLSTLIPVIGIVQVGEQSIAERYTYLSYIGLFIAIVWLAGDAVAHYPKIRIIAQLLVVAVLIVYTVKVNAQVKVWKNYITLFSHVYEVDPRGELPNLNLGIEYARQGKLDEAQVYLERALTYNPNGRYSLSNSAAYLMQTRDPHNLQLAGQRLEQALHVAPSDPDILDNMAAWSALMGRPKDEETYSERAIAAVPDSITPRLYLANALQDQGKLDEAAQEWHQVLAINPNYFIAHYSLGVILESRGLTEEALKEYRLSLAIQPNQAMSHSKIGRILLEAHHCPEAADEFTQALRYAPTNPNAHNDLGAALYQLGDYEKAAEQFSDAIGIDPGYGDARRNLDLALAKMKGDKSGSARR